MFYYGNMFKVQVSCSNSKYVLRRTKLVQYNIYLHNNLIERKEWYLKLVPDDKIINKYLTKSQKPLVTVLLLTVQSQIRNIC